MDVFDLYATISIKLDDFEKGLNQAKTKAESFAKNISGLSSSIDKAYSGIGDLLSPVVDGFKAVESVGGKAVSTITNGLKVVAGAATVAAGSAVAVGKSAFDAYADYEQLVGGVETLFKDSAGEVMGYANNAYKTAGMSANQYMELTTSFVASLLQSLDGDTSAAAKMADMAATDMADNWNKMGSTMESVQDAYKGFAKQNYTMLDNLKLGYGGTKSEMERLLADAEKFSGIKYNLDSYADIISAIHVIQTEMGITGTTALEASSTIQGSLASAKSAWENFTVGIADSNQDMGQLMDNLIDSVVTAGNNVVPRIQEIVNQVVRVGPEVIRGFSEIIPEFARMGGEIIGTLAEGLSAQLPALLEFGSKAVRWISDGISENAHKITDGITALITGIGRIIGENTEALANAGQAILGGILRVFNSASYQISQYIGDFVPLIANAFIQQHEALFRIGINILGAIGQGLAEDKEEIGWIASEAIASMVIALRDNAPAIIEGGIALLEALVGAIMENMPLILETGAEIIGQLVAGISTSMPALVAAVGLILPQIAKVIDVVENIGGAVKNVSKLVGENADFIMGIGGKLMTGIKALFTLVMAHPVIAVITAVIAAVVLLWTKCEWFRDGVKAVLEAVGGFFKSAYEVITGAFAGAVEFFGGIVDGIKGVFEGIGEFLGGLFKLAWELVQGAWDAAVGFFTEIGSGIQSVFEAVTSFLGDAFSAAWSAITAVWDAAVGFFSAIWDGISSAGKTAGEAIGNALKTAWDAVTKAWDGAVGFFGGIVSGIVGAFSDVGSKFLSIGKSIVDGLKNGIANAWNSFIGWLNDKVGGIVNGVKSMLGIHSPSTVFAGIGENMALGLAEGWDDQYTSIKRQIENGLSFGTATVGLSTNGTYISPGAVRNGSQTSFEGGGSFTVNIYNPEKRDAVTEAREWKKTAQRMAMGYV